MAQRNRIYEVCYPDLTEGDYLVGHPAPYIDGPLEWKTYHYNETEERFYDGETIIEENLIDPQHGIFFLLPISYTEFYKI